MGLVAGTKIWSLRLDFVAKMVSSHDATSPCDLLQRLVAGTSPIVCADLKVAFVSIRVGFRRVSPFALVHGQANDEHESSPANLALPVKFPKHHRNRNS